VDLARHSMADVVPQTIRPTTGCINANLIMQIQIPEGTTPRPPIPTLMGTLRESRLGRMWVAMRQTLAPATVGRTLLPIRGGVAIPGVAEIRAEVAVGTNFFSKPEFKGTPRQQRNQDVQVRLLQVAMLGLYFGAVMALGNRLWGFVSLFPVLLFGFYVCNRLIEGRLGEVLNGKREEPQLVAILVPEASPIQESAHVDIYSAPRRIDRGLSRDK